MRNGGFVIGDFMFPIFTIFGKEIGSYVICAAIGIFVACPIGIKLYKMRGGNDISMILMYLASAIGVFFGMHILYGITNISLWHTLGEATGFWDFILKFANIFGGSVFYGGLIGGLIAGHIYIKRTKMPIDTATDCAAVSIPLFHGISRVGCFLGGCCYGVEWKHGVTFTNSLVEQANGVPRVPVQLFEACYELLLFSLIFILINKTAGFKGKLLEVYLLLYAVGRFILEFWRGDDYRGYLFGLSTSQIIAVLMFAGSLFLLVRRRRTREN